MESILDSCELFFYCTEQNNELAILLLFLQELYIEAHLSDQKLLLSYLYYSLRLTVFNS